MTDIDLRMKDLERLRQKGTDAQRVTWTQLLTFFPSAVVISIIAATSDMDALWLAVAALLLASIRSWLNLRDMETFLRALDFDIKENK